MANLTDQQAFEAAVSHYCEGLDAVAVGCAGSQCEHAEGDENHSCEASFSWSTCDSCGSGLGGDRFPSFGLWRDAEGFHTLALDVCVDCAMYHANGELPETWR